MSRALVGRPADPLGASLVLLSLVVALALGGLAIEGNWPKLARVAAAAVLYVSCLWGAARATGGGGEVARWRHFAAAGAVAGLASGLLRPGTDPGPVLMDAAGAGIFLSTVHWLAVRCAPRLRARVSAS